jgi:hypothetical protein
LFYVTCLDVLADTMSLSSGEDTSFISLALQKLAFRFVTSIVLGVPYGRRILDLNDEMVSFNYQSGLGKHHKTFPEQ